MIQKRYLFSSALFSAALGLSTQSALAQSYIDPYLEAECPDGASGSYYNTLTSTSGFSGPGHLLSADNTTAAQYNGSSDDLATYQFELFEKTNYKVYFRVNTNGDPNDDSLFFKLGSYPWMTINGVASQGTGWVWVAGPSMLMSEAAATLQIANRENGLKIDKIAILRDTEPAPIGVGEPAYNCAVPVHFEAECRTEATAGYTIRHLAKAGFSGLGYLESQDNTYDSQTAEDTVSYEFETDNSVYSLHFRIHTNGSGNDDSFYFRIDGGSWLTINNVSSLGSNWLWVQGVSGYVLSKGKHTVEIANREDGLSLDKLAFIPQGSPAPSGVGQPGVNCFGDSDDWRASDVYDYSYGHTDYFAHYNSEVQEVEGAYLLREHVNWHARNGSGGQPFVPGAGTAFLGFHRAIQNRFEQYALENYGVKWEAIAVDAFLPYQLHDAFSALSVSGLDQQGNPFTDQYVPRESTDLTNIGHPGYLTVAGQTEVFGFEGSVYYSLNDIPSLNVLGRILGWTYHGAVHIKIAGTMFRTYSPSDPAFYLWHGRLDQIIDAWLNTSSGRAWMAANPNHPFLVPGFTQLTGWEPSDFPTEQ